MSKDLIFKALQDKGESTPQELKAITGVSRQYLHRKLKELQNEGLIVKLGQSPATFYQLSPQTAPIEEFPHTEAIVETLKENFYWPLPGGKVINGNEAFAYWCKLKKLPVVQTALQFDMAITRNRRFKTRYNCIDAIENIRPNFKFNDFKINQLYYLDFEKIDGFGKTRYSLFLDFSKNGQSIQYTRKLIDLVKNNILNLINRLEVDAIAFVPATLKREVQFMKMLQHSLSPAVPALKLIRIKGEVTIQQSSLTTIEERIQNAKMSIATSGNGRYKKVLLIDDIVQSGATMNEISNKMKKQGIAGQVYGLGIVGNKHWKSRPL